MAISRISQGNDTSALVAFSGSYIAGDFIVMTLQNTANSTTPSLPSGYTNWTSGADAANNHEMRVISKYATSSSETMPTFTNTTTVSWAIYRGVDPTTPFVQIAGQAGVSTSMSTSGIVSYQSPNDWVIVAATGKPITGNIGAHPPTSLTLVTEYKAGSDDNALFDSNAPLSSYSFNSKTLDASVSWITKTLELVAATTGSTPTNLFFAAM